MALNPAANQHTTYTTIETLQVHTAPRLACLVLKWVISFHVVDATRKGVWDMSRYGTFRK